MIEFTKEFTFLKINNKPKIYAFVGSSGSGKSYKAQQVAHLNNIDAIIDDGLLIRVNENKVLAGKSAKIAKTKIQTIRDALFEKEEQQKAINDIIKKEKVKSIMILGTSDAMVEKIRENLNLPEIKKIIYIEDVSTPQEIELAKKTRKEQGKHVVPVPTFEIKKDFSGILLDPLQIFRNKHTGSTYVSNKSLIRPTFSYIGSFTMENKVFRDIIKIIAKETRGIYKVDKIRVIKEEGESFISISIEVVAEFGFNIPDITERYKKVIKEKIEEFTQIYVSEIKVLVKGINI